MIITIIILIKSHNYIKVKQIGISDIISNNKDMKSSIVINYYVINYIEIGMNKK